MTSTNFFPVHEKHRGGFTGRNDLIAGKRPSFVNFREKAVN